MLKERKLILVMLVGLFLVGLACNVGGRDFTPPAVTIPAGAVETAQSAAGTAAVMAATGAAQGGAAVETAVAAGVVETAQAGVETAVAAGAVETAQAAAGTAAVMAATGAAQGGAAVETVAAMGTPDLGALQEKLEALRPDENGNVSVTITDDEVNQAIQAGEGNNGQNNLENAVVTFTSGGIVLVGDVTQPVAARLTVTFVPYVADGLVQFDITQATLGSVNVPPALLASAEGTLNSTLGDALNNLPGGVQVTGITMGEGTMVVVGRREP